MQYFDFSFLYYNGNILIFFSASSQLMLQTLVNASALPNEFAFENYDLNPPNSMNFIIIYFVYSYIIRNILLYNLSLQRLYIYIFFAFVLLFIS